MDSSISLAPPESGITSRVARRLKAFIRFWWVIPRVQWDLVDVEYQLYTFELFHRDVKTKLAHYVTIPSVSFFSMVFWAQFAPKQAPFGVHGGLAFAVLLSALHLAWSIRRGIWVVGAATTFVLLAMVVPATCFYEVMRVPGGPWYAPTIAAANPIMWIYLWGFLETLSHGIEPIPPHIGGEPRWQSHEEFWSKGGLWRYAAIAGAPTLHTITSLASNLHLLPTMVMRIMFSAGWLPALDAKIRAAIDREVQTPNPEIDRYPGARDALS